MPEAQHKALKRPYHKDRFTYDESTDYSCPQGQRLPIQGYEAHSWHTHAHVSPCLSEVCRVPGVRGLYQRPTPWTEIGPHDAA